MLPVAVGFLVGVGGLVLTAREYLRGRATAKWPTTEGVVVETRVEESGGGEGFSYKPVVVFRYQVAGAEYTSDRLSFGDDITNGSHSEAERLVSALPKGRPVTVRYDPTDPGRAVLVAGVPAGWLKWSAGFSVLSLVMAVVVWFLA